ncbi:MAG: CbiX/SirB N-terminal domain-containing protein [Pirellulales bacterium]
MPPQPLNLPIDTAQLGVILVDHGSRRDESNRLLLDVVREFAAKTGLPVVEPAHMELAEPSIATAFARCVDRGAKTVVVFPYFLLPGRHWYEDIPRLAAQAARSYPGLQFLVTAPFGLHPLMSEVIGQRIAHCLAHAQGDTAACDACDASDHCQLRGDGP